MRLTIWDPQKGEIPANLALTNNFAATTNPTVNDDSSLKYSVGSIWINVTLDLSFQCVDATDGAAVWNQTSSTGEQNAQFAAPAGANASLTGGAAAATNGNGSSGILAGGAGDGTGRQGAAIARGYVLLVKRPALAAVTVSAVLTVAQLLSGVSANQGAAGAASYQLPLAADLDTALPEAVTGDTFEFYVANVSTVAAEDATITTNTGWTLAGSMVVASNDAATSISSATFLARKTGTGTWTLSRIS